MKFYDVLTRDTLRDEINRSCGTTDSVYSLRDKLSRVNNALDYYWKLASDSAPKGTFDDTSNTSAPIETQNLVDGTNAYKLTDFTNEVLQILKISVLQDNGDEIDLVREEFVNYFEFLEWYSTDTADKGTPYAWTKYGDFIYIRPTPNYNETNGLRAYVNRELSKFEGVAFTTTNASNQIDATAHGLSNGDTIVMATNNALPSGYSADTVYYVINKATDSFQVATSGGGSAVTITTDGTGTHQFFHLNKEPGIPVIHHQYIARKASLPFLMEKKLPQMGNIAQMVVNDEQLIMDYWQTRDRDLSTVIRPRNRRYK